MRRVVPQMPRPGHRLDHRRHLERRVGIGQDRFWIYPGPMVGFHVWLRRIAPGLLWKRVRQVEGG